MVQDKILKATYEALRWLPTLTASDVHHVKQETQELLSHLKTSLTSLWDITEKIASVPDAEFPKHFRDVYNYFKKFYYGDENFEKVRTHSTDLERDISRIKYKLAVFLRTDVPRWNEANEGLRIAVLQDVNYIMEYQGNLK